MYREIVSLFIWNYQNWKTYFGKIWLYNTTIMRIIRLPFFPHKKIIRGTNRTYKTFGTIRFVTKIVSISNIFCMFSSVDNRRIYSSIYKPTVNDWKIIIFVARITSMMIESFCFSENLIPVRRRDIKTRIIFICR